MRRTLVSPVLFLALFSCWCCCRSDAFAPSTSNDCLLSTGTALHGRPGSSNVIDDAAEDLQVHVSYRPGKQSDQNKIAKAMVSELMNPLGLNPIRFCIAEARDGQTVGWGQIKPHGPAIYDRSKYNSSPGSGSIEENVDEDIWFEFEEDNADFPNGLSSLPWSPSYRTAAEAAKRRREKRAIMTGKERLEVPQIWELSSVYVYPQYRSMGVGKSIVRELLHQHSKMDRDTRQVYALTLRRTYPFYQALGFKIVENVEDIPSQMKLEIAVGRFITKVLGEELVCLKATDSK